MPVTDVHHLENVRGESLLGIGSFLACHMLKKLPCSYKNRWTDEKLIPRAILRGVLVASGREKFPPNPDPLLPDQTSAPIIG